MSAWKTIALALGGQAALLIVLGVLARELLNNWMSKDLELHKANLAHQNEQAMESMRHQFGMAAQEHSLKVAQLQSRRAAVIADIYGLLADVEWESSVYVNLADLTGQNSNDAQYALVTEKVDQFYRHFNRHRIYLPEDTCQTVGALMNGMVQAANKMKAYLYDSARSGRPVTKEQLDAYMTAHEHFSKHHGEARKKLERDLRAIMGDPVQT